MILCKRDVLPFEGPVAVLAYGFAIKSELIHFRTLYLLQNKMPGPAYPIHPAGRIAGAVLPDTGNPACRIPARKNAYQENF